MMDSTGGERRPALQVIVLGPGGGPQEANTTAFLVRSLAQSWRKGSVIAVDAGIHLSAITRLLRETQPPPPGPDPPHTLTRGPFAGLSLPHRTPDANAGYITSSLIESYLITHPHLDHISGFVINTAGPTGPRPKKLVGLPGTIHALKTHIFNNVIWPNLSDENNGAGLVTYLRLVEGGSPALGVGQGKGYSEVCDGLLVKIWAVSHGHCIEKHSHRGSASSASGLGTSAHDPAALAGAAALSPRREPHSFASASQTPRRHSLLGQATLGGGGGGGGAVSPLGNPHGNPSSSASTAAAAAALTAPGGTGEQERVCVYDSSAYFIQEQEQHREVLMFGDVEPDSMSLSPRNHQVWREAAPKVADGSLAAVFIECSYDDGRGNDRLFGHLKPVFVIEELCVLAAEVAAVRREKTAAAAAATATATDGAAAAIGHPAHDDQAARRKRKRTSTGGPGDEPVSPKTAKAAPDEYDDADEHQDPLSTAIRAAAAQLGGSATSELALRGNRGSEPHPEAGSPADGAWDLRGQLEGLKVVLIHIKEQLSDDEPDVAATILGEVRAHDQEAQLGCEFVVARAGESFYL